MSHDSAAWIEGGGQQAARYRLELGPATVRLGHEASCSLRLSDPLVSRQHAEIRYQAHNYILKDLGSGNGTLVNGQRVGETTLRDGDTIRLGETELVFRISPASKPAAISSTAGSSSRKPKRSPLALLLVGVASLVALGVCACGAIFVLSRLSGTNRQAASQAPGAVQPAESAIAPTSSPLDLQAALTIAAQDERSELLARLGRPDVFTISDQEVEGGRVRYEAWQYDQFGLQVDLVDGAILWTMDIDPGPAGSIYPAWYGPLDFELGSSPDTVMKLAAELSPGGQPPTLIDLAEGGDELSGVLMLAGDQILFGFQDGRLVYVETVALTPGENQP